jgi:hypothetical protein
VVFQEPAAKRTIFNPYFAGKKHLTNRRVTDTVRRMTGRPSDAFGQRFDYFCQLEFRQMRKQKLLRLFCPFIALT